MFDEEPNEERPSIIQDIVFYEKPGISNSTEADLFDRRRSRRITRKPANTIKIESEEIPIKSEVLEEGLRSSSTLSFLHSSFIQSEETIEREESEVDSNLDTNLIIDETNFTSENVVEILPSDVSDNTKTTTKPIVDDENVKNEAENDQNELRLRKSLRVYSRKTKSAPSGKSASKEQPREKLKETVNKNRRWHPSKNFHEIVEDKTEDPLAVFEGPEKKQKTKGSMVTLISRVEKKLLPECSKKKKAWKKATAPPKKGQEVVDNELTMLRQIAQPSATPTKKYLIQRKEVSTPKLDEAVINEEKYSELVREFQRMHQDEPHKDKPSESAVPVNIISVQTIKNSQNSLEEKRIVIQSVHDKVNKRTKLEKNNEDSSQNSSGKKQDFKRMSFEKLRESTKATPVQSDTDGDAFKILPNSEADNTALESGEEEWVPEEYMEYKKKYASKVYRCEQCKQDFLTQDDIVSHVAETEHVTAINNEVFLTAGGVELQKVTSKTVEVDDLDDDRPEWIPEDYAEYKFKHLISTKRSIRVHKCKICLEIFKSYYLLCKHKITHMSRKNPYECRQCQDSFDNLEKFTAHIRMHQGKNPYPCKKCDIGFMTKEELEEHSRIHILKKNPPKAKRFRCDICGKEFSKLCDMERHTRVHTGEKPAECNICHKRFQQTHNLSKHLLTHLQVKPFQCDICNKKFGRIDVLNRHLLTHSLDKPFKCLVCPRGFIRQIQLDGHIKKHHSDTQNPDDLNADAQNTDDFNENDNDSSSARVEQEEGIDITVVADVEADVPERVDLVKDLVEHNEGDSGGNRIEINYEEEEELNSRENPNKIIIQQVNEIERLPHTNDPNSIIEGILNPRENVREQIIDEIN